MKLINIIKSIRQVGRDMAAYRRRNTKLNSLPHLIKSEVRIEELLKKN